MEPYTNQQEKFSIHPLSVVSSTISLGTMQKVGYLPIDVPFFESKHSKKECHSFFGSQLRQSGVEYDREKFARACTSHIAANKGVSKYGDDCSLNIGDFNIQEQLNDVLPFFGEGIRDTVPILLPTQVIVASKTAPGRLWKQLYKGYKFPPQERLDKRWILEHHAEYIHRHWVHAHKVNYPEPWSSAVKEELLSMKKLRAYDHRCFIIGSTEFFFNKARLNQAFNRSLSGIWYSQLPIKVGIDFTRGGFVQFIRNMIPSPEWDLCLSGDLTKWDARMALPLFFIALCIRYHCWDKKGMTTDEWFDRQVYYYWQTIQSYIITPSGQVVLKLLGNPSGDGNTTYDNCLGHLPIVNYVFKRITGKPLFALWNVMLRGGLYADDHLFSLRGFSPASVSFSVRSVLYKNAGGLLKEEDDKVTSTPAGQPFLGLVATWSDDYSCYVPMFNRDKACNSFEQPGKAMTHQVILDRAIAISGLVTFDYVCFDAMYRICVRFSKENVRHLQRSHVPEHHEWVAFWLGQESSSLISNFSFESCLDTWKQVEIEGDDDDPIL